MPALTARVLRWAARSQARSWRCRRAHRRSPGSRGLPRPAPARTRTPAGCGTTAENTQPQWRGSQGSARPEWSARSCASSHGLEPGGAAGLGKLAHTQDIALALGHRDDAAGVEQIEDVRGLDALIVGRQCHLVAHVLAALLQQRFALG